GSQTEIVFDGGSLVYDINGRLVKEMKYFEEDSGVFDLETLSKPVHKKEVAVHGNNGIKDLPPKEALEVSSESLGGGQEGSVRKYFYSATEVGRDKDILEYLTEEKNIQEIHDALILGIRDYFQKMGFTKATLGASGGIDSA